MVIDFPYKYQDGWGRERVKLLRYQRDVDPHTGHVLWTLLPSDGAIVADSATETRLRVVALGGGTGLPVVLRGLRPFAVPPGDGGRRMDLTAVVTMADDGGSSGELRRQLGVLPPGDVRNCLLALAPQATLLSGVLEHRFEEADGLGGHSLGNLFLAASAQVRGDFVEAIALTQSLLGAVGRVLPCTQDPVVLEAEFEDGTVVAGESQIAARRGRIRRVRLAPPTVRPAPQALDAILSADLIVVGPGSLYTSLLPILLVPRVADGMRASGAVRVLVANLMTQPGETDGYDVADHLAAFEAHAGPGLFDFVLVNRAPLPETVRARYGDEGAHPVAFDSSRLWEGAPVCLLDGLAAEGGLARHDPERLAWALLAVAAMAQDKGRSTESEYRDVRRKLFHRLKPTLQETAGGAGSLARM
jgi:uncharacterized cofD-like protein